MPTVSTRQRGGVLAASCAALAAVGMVAMTAAEPMAQAAVAAPAQLPPSSAYLGLLPDGEAKRRFVLDCTGCHLFNEQTAFPQGAPRSHASWVERTNAMIAMFGASSGFPIIPEARAAEPTADWLAEHVKTPPSAEPALRTGSLGNADIREYPFPAPQDLPHDVAVQADGRVVVTGMFTHQMWVLDPETGDYSQVAIPVPGANPRAVEIDDEGIWWVLLGNPRKVAGYDPRTQQWSVHDVGMYPHSIFRDAANRVWFNGHFSAEPEQIGYVEIASGAVRTFDVPQTPAPAAGGTPIPYGLRVAPNGIVWGTELHGNRIFSFDPASERFEVFVMPTSYSGPRRPDVGADGILWIPEYSGDKLTRFDPATKQFRQYELPIANALPYVVRTDQRDGTVWIGSAAADAMFAFDPATEQFTTYRLPTRGALIRHISVDRRNGDVWIAYGASPGIPNKIARLRRR